MSRRRPTGRGRTGDRSGQGSGGCPRARPVSSPAGSSGRGGAQRDVVGHTGARSQAHERTCARAGTLTVGELLRAGTARRRDRRCERGPPQRGGSVAGASGGRAAGQQSAGQRRACAEVRSRPLSGEMVPTRHASEPEQSGLERRRGGQSRLLWDADAGIPAGAEWRCAIVC